MQAVTATRSTWQNINDVLIRTLDVTCSIVGLLFLSPLFLLVAIAIRLDSPGPVLFRHERMGQNFRLFDVFKFRTMVNTPNKSGRMITVGEDARITRLGRFLRRLKIDELPQLLNVIKGDMSLVGPRPESPKYVAMFHADFEQLLTVRPGITDPASIVFRDESRLLAEFEDPEHAYVVSVLPKKIQLAREYVEYRSLGRYVQLIGRTLWAVFFSPDSANPAATSEASNTHSQEPENDTQLG